MDNIITQEQINTYCASMLADERAAGTISKYRRDVTAFARWLGGRAVTKETASGWKAHLLTHGYAPRRAVGRIRRGSARGARPEKAGAGF